MRVLVLAILIPLALGTFTDAVSQDCSSLPIVDNSNQYHNSAGQPQAVAFPASAEINAWIDTSEIAVGSQLYSAIVQSWHVIFDYHLQPNRA